MQRAWRTSWTSASLPPIWRTTLWRITPGSAPTSATTCTAAVLHPDDPCDFSQVPALIRAGDTFLLNTVNAIMTSKAWRGSSVIFIAWDESDFRDSGPFGRRYERLLQCESGRRACVGAGDFEPAALCGNF